ncbi:transcription initiation factor IIA subunit 2-like [Drosophila kikkawai]|uniref:Transcription initiation factor IIA subunit 2 n=1 Tax=Drosophila kikkawai TaxID=30033 RepID=A0A6P4I135_DROKI|nr:transcription initiation factor IIA subunit 2-like [Drosophila kikkawai]KAH8315636.1 hypothetical protein KR059_006938 [Drosophila kikkawai]
MAYKMYRGTTLGETLQETLDYLIQFGDLNPNLAEDVLDQFDRSVNRLLRHNDKPQLTFKGDKLDVYRFCDKVWILILKDVVFYERDGREKHEILHVGKMKIVACETRIGM